ncbi:MAG: hypothetical protein ACTSU5_19830 [Promethearchaeota archaeon]
MLFAEILGYTASVLVAVSLTMKNVLRLRVINMVGAVVFTTYGFLISAYPVALMNGFIVAINIYYLHKLLAKQDYFKLLPVSPNSLYLKKFLEFHAEEIATFFPEFELAQLEGTRCTLILRNLFPVGVFVYKTSGTFAYILLDYVIPEYRDFKNARFLFSRTDELFSGLEITNIVTRSHEKRHMKYLEKMQFQPDPDDPTLYFRPT